MFNIIPLHTRLWERFQNLLLKKRVPQSLLFVGPRHAGILQFANRLMAILLCANEAAPCTHCRTCHLIETAIHPDITYLSPESPGNIIKIEQIRELQQTIFQTPQIGERRFIVIEPANKMNTASANALLKILEEPPSHTTFILIADQISSIPATILSRCQKYMFPCQSSASGRREGNYLQLGESYPTESSRAELVKNAPTITSALCEMIQGRSSPCSLAAQWTSYDFNDLLWLLYLITAQAIRYNLINNKDYFIEMESMKSLAYTLPSAKLFNQLNKINVILRKINHNINMNQTLALEDLLLGYLEDVYPKGL